MWIRSWTHSAGTAVSRVCATKCSAMWRGAMPCEPVFRQLPRDPGAKPGGGLVLLVIAGAAIAPGSAINHAPIRQGYATRIHEARGVFSEIPVDDERVTQLDVAALEPSPRQGARTGAFTSPVRNAAFVVFHI